MLQYIHSLYYMFMKLYLVLLQVCGAMGVRRNFSRGGAKSTFCLSFQVVGDATQIDVYKKRKCPMLWQQLHTVFSLQETFTLSKCLFW